MNGNDSSDSSDQVGNAAKSVAKSVKLILICHGEGMQHRYADLGSVNSGLTAKGWEQVEIVSAWLGTHVKIDSLFSGPLLQCRLTAQRIGQSINRNVTVLRDLSWETVDVVERTADPNPSDQSSGATQETPGASLMPVLNEVLEKQSNDTVAIVLSATTIQSILRSLMACSDTVFSLEHTGISCLTMSDATWQVEYINRLEHLPTPAIEQTVERPIVEVPLEEQDIGSVIRVYNRVASEDVADKADNDWERIQSLVRFADLPEGANVLDVGTGLGVLAMAFAEAGASSVIGVDISPGMLEQAEYLRLSQPSDTSGHVSFRLARMQALPFPDERFDAVTCRLVLNHFKSPQRVIQEIVRVLKPNGIFVMAEMLSVDDPVKRATQNAIEERRNPSHVAARSAEQYEKLITQAGLEIEDTSTVVIDREMKEWLEAYRASTADAATVMDMIEAGLETDAAGIGARRRGDRIMFQQRIYYLKAVKPA